MAKAQMLFPDDLTERLSKLGEKTGEIAEKVLEAGGKVALEIVRDQLDQAIGNTKFESRSTGELKKALGLSPVDVDRKGVYNIKIGFAEPREIGSLENGTYDETSNAKIANIIEYGKHGQPAKPFLKRAMRRTPRVCKRVMKEVFDEEVGKL